MAADELDTIRFAGFKLGFWFANQGSMVIFVILIWTYVWMMNRLDIKYGVHEG
jgi:putative solute:sodium symporter small subunit